MPVPDGERERLRLHFRLEFDHLRPRALGGPSTIDNVRLACRPHNQLAARRVFGDAWMDRFTRRQEEQAATAAPY